MKKLLLALALFGLITSLAACGSGSGTSSQPAGVNSGLSASVQLLATSYISQTGDCITLKAKIRDGNGVPITDSPVTFTVLQQTAVALLSDACQGAGSAALTTNTDNLGYATVYANSAVQGFVTILAQYNGGGSALKDRKILYFSGQDFLAVSMSLDVQSVPSDRPGSPFTLFEQPFDDTVAITATVFDAGGAPVRPVDKNGVPNGQSVPVLWSSDHAEVKFIQQDNQTDINGQAKAIVQVVPESIRNTQTHVNVMASAGNGAANEVTLFLNPVVISGASSLTADPNIVFTGSTSSINALLLLNTGYPIFDGVTVNFKTAPGTAGSPSPCGTVTPFVQTSGGFANATFTAPQAVGTGTFAKCTITATSNGAPIGSGVDVTVIKHLALSPSGVSRTIDTTAGATVPACPTPGSHCTSVTYTITGGLPPYSASSSDPTNALVGTINTTTSQFDVTIGENICGSPGGVGATCTATVTITAQDSTGATASATANITVKFP